MTDSSTARPTLSQDEADASRAEVRVLLVDDQVLIADLVQEMLGDAEDVRFEYCGNPERALSAAKSFRPTVILQDLVMPGCHGLDLVEQYRASLTLREVPVIVLSAEDSAEAKVEAFQRGVADYLIKPPDPIELLARLRRHSASFRHLCELNEATEQLRDFAQLLQVEQFKSDELLLNILPEKIAERLKDGEEIIADNFPEVSVLFADIVNFTSLARILEPRQLVLVLNEVFSAFDEIADVFGLEKIKTIGDAYLLVAGLPEPIEHHAAAATDMGLAMLERREAMKHLLPEGLEFRIGISSGPVTAGVIGKRKFIYDLWGDTVNLASRMESHGLPGCVHVSDETRRRLGSGYEVEPRGTIDVKGLGPMATYVVKGKSG